jgi:hypothetical protein
MVMPATRIARIVPYPVGPAAVALEDMAPFRAGHRWHRLSLPGMMNNNRSGLAHGVTSGTLSSRLDGHPGRGPERS